MSEYAVPYAFSHWWSHDDSASILGILIMHSSSSIRVLHLGSSIGLYGAERWMLALVKALPRPRIHSIVSILRKDSNKEPELCEQANLLALEAYVFEAHRRVSWEVIFQLRQFIIDRQIDILHTHGYKTDAIGLLAVRGTKCKILTTPHGWTINPSLKLQLYEYFDRLIFPFFDAIVPVSQKLYEGVRRIPGVGSKAVLIEGGIDLEEIDNIRYMDRGILKWKNDGFFVVGYLGRLIEGKGIATLLKAIKLTGNTQIRLAILGDGILLNELKHFAMSCSIADAVRFFGFQDNRISYLRGFDIFVLPSRSEGLPQCLMEAMAIGIPVVVSDIPGCRTLVDDNVTGLLFPVDDASGLAEKINLLFANTQLRDAIGRGGRALVRSRYTSEIMAERYANLYTDLFEGKFSLNVKL